MIGARTIPIQPRLVALCPRCAIWFDCPGWRPPAAPACPRCHTPAQQVVRPEARHGARPHDLDNPEVWIG